MLLEDDLLILEINGMRDDVHDEWELCKQIAKDFPDLFPPDGVNEKNLAWATNLLFTRAFDLGCPFTIVVPFADCFNHYNMDSGCELFCPPLHKVGSVEI
jgi:hypothetical protein